MESRVATARLLQCPASDRAELFDADFAQGVNTAIVFIDDYGGVWAPWITTTDYATNGGLLGYAPRSARRLNGQLTRVSRSEQTVLAGDAVGDAMGWVPTQYGVKISPVTLSDVATGSDRIDFTLYSFVFARPLIPSGVGVCHNGKANVLFVDGHVEAVSGDQTALRRCLLLP